MRVELTDYDVWSFYRVDGSDHWKWCRRSPDGDVLIEARESLPSLEACQEDARRFGYNTQSVVHE